MRSALAVLVVVVLLPVGSLAARWAWLSRRRRLETWWEETVGPVLHPPRALDVAALQRRISAVALRQVSVTDRGVAVLPAAFRVEVSDHDAGRLGPLRHIVEAELADALGSEAVKRSWLRPERVRVTITAGDAIDGRPRVRAVLGPEAVDRPAPGTTGPAATGIGTTGTGTTGLGAAGLGTTGPGWTDPGTDGRGVTRLAGTAPEPMGFQAADPQTVDAGTTDATTTGSAATVGPRGLHPAGSGRTAPRRTTVPAAAPAPVLPAAGTSRIVVCELISADGGRDIDLTDRTERVTVGRVDTDVVLDDGRVSYRHAELVPAAGGQWLLDDTDSLNGTWVNGRRVERASLVHGDEVRFAGSGPRFLFSRLAGAGR